MIDFDLFTQLLSTDFNFPQVWFQNRRAKFRRNERSVITGKTGAQTSDHEAVEQPLVSKNVGGKSIFIDVF